MYKIKISRKNLLFYIGFIPYYISCFLSGTNYADMLVRVLPILRYFSYAWFTFMIISSRMFNTKYKKVILMILLIVAFAISSRLTGSNTYIYYVLILLAAKNIDLKEFFQDFFYVVLFLIIFVLLSFSLGIIQDNISVRGLDLTERHSLGFYFSNNLSVHVLYLELLLFLGFENRNLKFKYIAILLAHFIIYYFTLSRTAFILGIFVVFFHALYCRGFDFTLFIKNKIPIIITTILYTGPIILGIAFNEVSNFWRILSTKWFTSRISVQNRAFFYYGISFWGNRKILSDDAIKKGIFLDSSIFEIFLIDGLFVYIVIFIMLVLLVRELSLKKMIVPLVFLWVSLLDGWWEHFFTEMSYNLILFLFLCIINKKKNFSMKSLGYFRHNLRG